VSTGLNCEFIEPVPGDWYYILEDYFAPKNSWNWLEYATAYGPFNSQEDAAEHLREHHANPGGSWTIPHSEFKMTVEYKQLIMEANAERKKKGSSFWW
jgi:hypothetical protein